MTRAQGSIIAVFDLPSTILYPLSLVSFGGGSVTLNLAYLKSRSAFASDAAREAIYVRVAALVGPLSTRNLNGHPKFAAAKLNDPAVGVGVVDILLDLVTSAADSGA